MLRWVSGNTSARWDYRLDIDAIVGVVDEGGRRWRTGVSPRIYC